MSVPTQFEMIAIVLRQQRDACEALGLTEIVQRLDGALMRLESLK